MKQNRFLLLLVAVVLGMGWATRAAAQKNGLWVERKSGSRVGYVFTQEPKISYSGATMIIRAGSAQAEIPVSDVERISFADDVTPTAIREAVAGGRGELVRLTAEGASLEGFTAGTAVTVYDASGRMVGRTAADAEGRASVGLAGLPGGLYIVRAGENVVKIKRLKN